MKKTNNYQEQVYKLLRKDINDDIKNGRKKSNKDYLNKCETYLNDLCCGWKPASFSYIKRRRNEKAALMWLEMKGYFEGIIDVLVQDSKAKNMIRHINTISTEALISNAMKEAGLEFLYEGQQYRAKVSVKLTPTNKLVFYLSYKKAAELLPGAIESAIQARALLSKLGNSASIKKCCSWEQWI